MKKEKRKQIILIIVSFLLIGIGCFNSKTNDFLEVASSNIVENEINLGDVQLVSSNAINNEESQNLFSIGIVSNENFTENNVSSNFVQNSNTIVETKSNVDEKEKDFVETNMEDKNQYFMETRLDRDRMYSEMLETYQKMLDNSEVTGDQKAIATQEINNITNTKNGIMISENLIKNKGFEDVVILVNNGIVSVIVKSTLLNQEQIAKVQNIVSRELNVQVQNINISNK